MEDSSRIHVNDAVALTCSIENPPLPAGQVGTVVDQLAEDVFEVEFCDEEGVTFAMATIPASQLLRLRY